TLHHFLDEAAVDLEDVYRNPGWSWTRLKREAGHEALLTDRVADAPIVDPRDAKLLNGVGRLLHMDDSGRLTFLRDLLQSGIPVLTLAQQRMLEGFLLTLGAEESHLRQSPTVRDEI